MEEKFAQATEDNEENMSDEHTQSVNRRRISGNKRISDSPKRQFGECFVGKVEINGLLGVDLVFKGF